MGSREDCGPPMARGDYELITETPFQSVGSHPRRYGVMFSPSSSRSRLRIVDSGRRYSVRLQLDGTVQYSVDGDVSWHPIRPLPEPCTGEILPAFVSHDQWRSGRPLAGVRFDMLAVGRGRIIAKEAGTDRLFHCVIDELFRGHRVSGADCDVDVNVGCRSEDPPVPGFYMKLDPEYYRTGPPSLIVPPAARRDYAGHPASGRLPAFAELLELGAADVMIVLQRARTWYLVDARSPRSIVGPEDLQFTEADFKAVFTEQVIHDILSAALKAAERMLDGGVGRGIEHLVEGQLRQFLPHVATDGLRESFASLGPISDLLDGLVKAVVDWLAGGVAPWLAELIANSVPTTLIDTLAETVGKNIQDEGYGALVLPAYVALGFLLYGARVSKAIKTEAGVFMLDPRVLSATLPENRPLSDAIARLMLLSRRREATPPPGHSQWSEGMPTPNQPPGWLPTYLHTRYVPRSPAADTLGDLAGATSPEERFAIQFSKVLDLGVGYSHWSEQWQQHFGGEIHSLLATRPIFQQEQYNLMQYRLLNGPVIDGDGFNDGTTNFYMLVKLGPAGADDTALPQRYAILWIDEQTYFTQRWRLLDPTEDVLGDLFSLAHSLKRNPEWFHFSRERFWSPFNDDLINDNSRMAVRRQIVAVTGYNHADQRHEIYTICFNYGVSDHTWRWRRYPAAEQVIVDAATAQDADQDFPAIMNSGSANAYVAVNTLDLRDDTTLHVRGTRRERAGAPLRAGRWVQRYLPADCRHVPAPHQLTGGKPKVGFGHGWDFVSETAYRRADQFYQFGVYEPDIDSRCQYYEVELLPGEDGRVPDVQDVVGGVWRNDQESSPVERLHHNTTNFVWKPTKNNSGMIELSGDALLRDRRTLPTMSMYEPTTRFRLLERKPHGVILVFYDKRDDELQPASDLPHETLLREDFEDAAIPTEWGNETGGQACGPTPFPRPPRTIRLLVKRNKRLLHPPIVRKAQVIVRGVNLSISFWTPQTEDEVNENIWKVNLAAIDDTGVVPICSLTRHGTFIRRGRPDAPLPFNHAGDLGDEWRYDGLYKVDPKMIERVNRFCTPAGHVDYATSLWFEDIVGHRGVAEETLFG
ncbi:hypothetical protein [Micromonospora chersina]|uniref:hypothetical protein n=1 Tax=Micromonospora chersina TaxID=47854 RepID=UPI00371E1678